MEFTLGGLRDPSARSGLSLLFFVFDPTDTRELAMFILHWKAEIGIGDVLTFLGFLAAAAGLVFTAIQIRRGAKTQRAQFLLETTERYFGDTEGRRLYYVIDYGTFKLDFENGNPKMVHRSGIAKKPFIGSDEERWLDNLLYTLDVIGRIAELGALTRQEARIFAFQAARVFKNADVRSFLAWLDEERKRFGGEVPSHKAGRKLADLPC